MQNTGVRRQNKESLSAGIFYKKVYHACPEERRGKHEGKMSFRPKPLRTAGIKDG